MAGRTRKAAAESEEIIDATSDEFNPQALQMNVLTDLTHGVKAMRVVGGVIYYAQGSSNFVPES